MRRVQNLFVGESRELSSTEVTEHGAVYRERVFFETVPGSRLVGTRGGGAIEPEEQEDVFHLG